MGNLSFADVYRSAQFTLAPQNMALRQQSADRFLKTVAVNDRLGLVKLHMGLTTEAFGTRLTEVFRADDPTFSLVDNAREAVVISTALLAALIDRNDLVATLALVAGGFAGLRSAPVRPDLVELAKKRLYELAVGSHGHSSGVRELAPASTLSKTQGQVDAWVAQAPDFPKLVPVLKQISTDADGALRTTAKNAQQAVGELANQMRDLREELDMLWWSIAGTSTQLEKSYIDLAPQIVGLVAGIELAMLARTDTGPAAAAALIQLRLTACKSQKRCTISEAVNGVSAAGMSLGITPPADTEDLLPMLTAIKTRASTGEDNAWQPVLRRLTGLDANTTVSPLDLGMQVYREVLLARALQGRANA